MTKGYILTIHRMDRNIEYSIEPYENNLKQLYRLIECDTVAVNPYTRYMHDMQEITTPYHLDIWLDDNGKLTNRKPTMLYVQDNKVKTYLVGNLSLLLTIGDDSSGMSYEVCEALIKLLRTYETIVKEQNGDTYRAIVYEM